MRKVDSSVIIVISPIFLKGIKISSESIFDVSIQEGPLFFNSILKPKHKLADVLSKCDPKVGMSKEEKSCIELAPFGNEIL